MKSGPSKAAEGTDMCVCVCVCDCLVAQLVQGSCSCFPDLPSCQPLIGLQLHAASREPAEQREDVRALQLHGAG